MQYVFDSNVQLTLLQMRAKKAREKAAKAAKTSRGLSIGHRAFKAA